MKQILIDVTISFDFSQYTRSRYPIQKSIQLRRKLTLGHILQTPVYLCAYIYGSTASLTLNRPIVQGLRPRPIQSTMRDVQLYVCVYVYSLAMHFLQKSFYVGQSLWKFWIRTPGASTSPVPFTRLTHFDPFKSTLTYLDLF